MENRIAIVGNPNTGKTSLFNTLTGSKQKTANYSGVTVGETLKKIMLNDREFEIVDLPGIYSFVSESEDEVVTKNYLADHKEEEIVYVCSSCDIRKNLILLTDLIKQGYRLKIVINQIGNKLTEDQLNKLKQTLNVPVVQVDVRKNKNALIDWITNQVASKVDNIVDLDNLLKIFNDNYKSIKKLDYILLHPFWGKVLFFVVIFGVIYLSYGQFGNSISLYLEKQLIVGSQKLATSLGFCDIVWLNSFWDNVVIGAVGTVIVYMPQLALMLSMLFLLEDIGYLPRVATVFNFNLEDLGLNGKSIFSLVMGVGCTTSAMLTTRNIGSNYARVNTARFLPFVGCSAKIPIVIYVSQVLLGGLNIIYIFLLYLSVLTVGLVFIKITNKNSQSKEYFISEIPRIKFPSIKTIVRQSIVIVFDLLKKVLLTVFVSAVILWLLMNVTPSFKFFSGEKSVLLYLSEWLSYLFNPLGLGRVDVVVALLFGLIAKENVVSVMGLFGMVSTLSVTQALTFLIFIMLYTPCLPALKCARCEFGKKFAYKMFFNQMIIAYFGALVFSTFSHFSIILGFVMIIIFCGFAFAISKFNIKLFKKTKNIA